MRRVGGLTALVLGAALAVTPTAQGQEGCARPDALGVARTIDIDATGGPWLGAPYGDPELLRPGEVVLTFDDGPVPRTTRPILAALAAECTKATFFMVGRMAAAYPDVVREVAAQGHTVGTHTWSHANLGGASPDRMRAQIESAIATVEKAVGEPVAPFFRYPYLSSSRASVAYLKDRGIAQIAVDIDSSDYLARKPRSVVQRVMARTVAKGRGIILLHDIHLWTARAVPDLLAHLKEEGFKVVHLRPKAPVEALALAEAETLIPKAGAVSARTPPRRSEPVKPPRSQGWSSQPQGWPPWAPF